MATCTHAPLDQLVEMGFPRDRAEKALALSGNKGAEAAMEWLLSHPEEDAAGHVLGQLSPEGSGVEFGGVIAGDQQQSLQQALSIKCDQCGKLLRSERQAQTHATQTGHSQFSESVEEIKPLTEEEKKEQQKKLQDLIKQKKAERLERERKEELGKEKVRRKGGRELAEAKQKIEMREAQKLAEQKRHEQHEEAIARQRVREQIAKDRAERQSKIKEKQTSECSSISSVQQNKQESKVLTSQREYTECRLQIRLTDGSALRTSFKPGDTLRTVMNYVATNRTDPHGPFTLTTYPGRKDFGRTDESLTLKDAGLVPSSVLFVKKV